MSAGFRCSVCGTDHVHPGPLLYAPGDRYAKGHCTVCRRKRQLIKAETREEATAGYKALQEEQRAKRAALKAQHPANEGR